MSGPESFWRSAVPDPTDSREERAARIVAGYFAARRTFLEALTEGT